MDGRQGDGCAQTWLAVLSWTPRGVEEAGKDPNP